MTHLDLSGREIKELEHIFKSTEDRRLRDRAQAMLMLHRGQSQPQVAVDLAVDERTVRRWVERWRADGVEGLRIRWPPGASPLISEPLTQEIVDWVRKGPVACGLNCANWTASKLAAHLHKVHGVRVAVRTMRDFCQRHDIHPYRPTYRLLRADPNKQARAREELARAQKKPRQASASC
jgi:transposase